MLIGFPIETIVYWRPWVRLAIKRRAENQKDGGTGMRIGIVAGVLLGSVAGQLSAQTSPISLDEVATDIRQIVEAMGPNSPIVIEQTSVGATDFVRDFYDRRQFQPAWMDDQDVTDLIRAIENADSDGLQISDFHLDDIFALRSLDGQDAESIAGRDLLLTDALVRLGYQLYYGKVDPKSLDATWNIDRPLVDRDPVVIVEESLENDHIDDLLASLPPTGNIYQKLRKALVAERSRVDQVHELVPEGPTLRKGDSNARVASLRRRLGLSDNVLFDEDLEAAVRRFQDQNGLDVDGLVGKGTIAALNITPQQRIDKLRVNMERSRWLRDVGEQPTFIAVNVAGFTVYYVKDGELAWESRAIVGKPYRKTPIFGDQLKYLVFNPTWTPTARIVRDSILPGIDADPDYLQNQNIIVYDSAGDVVPPEQVNRSNPHWYRFVQQPGPANALGRVKFMFPNEHAVYLHDTPSRNLFDRNARAFSSGCIRVENPIELAELLLADQGDWQPGRISNVLASGDMETVYVDDPVPVYLLYWTADPAIDSDQVHYLPDIYERDGPILEALNEPL